MHLAYRSTYTEGEGKNLKHSSIWESYYCSNFYCRKDKYKRYLENCTGITGIIYNFHTKNLVSFEDNLQYIGDLPLVA